MLLLLSHHQAYCKGVAKLWYTRVRDSRKGNCCRRRVAILGRCGKDRSKGATLCTSWIRWARSDLCSNMLLAVHKLLRAIPQPDISARFRAVPLILRLLVYSRAVLPQENAQECYQRNTLPPAPLLFHYQLQGRVYTSTAALRAAVGEHSH